ncbi:hypothetical protein LBMAG42_10390 [Deltaproteobacteria bacterium]|nr:hypothetical protein LBMAG42_10390 [Deltaproteobacteria bacterium]
MPAATRTIVRYDPCMIVPMLAVLAACGPEPVEFTLAPEILEFGTVAFPPEMPDGGYAELQLTVTNTGETDGNLTLPEPDPEIFCISGFTTQEFPVDVGTVNPGSAYVFTVALCGYPPGNAGTEVSTSFDILTDGDPETLTVPVTFTPDRVTE